LRNQLATLALIGLIVACIGLSGTVTIVRAQLDLRLSFGKLLYTAEKVGENFNVTVYLSFVEASRRIVGVQFRVTYDPTLVEALQVYEGPFLRQFNNTAESPYTSLTSYIEVDPVYGSNVLVGLLVLPNETGVWSNFPRGTGALATITFKALYRPMEPDTLTMPLTLVNTQIVDDNLDEVSHTILDASYNPTPITRPTLTITPATYTASVIGETFNSTVNINNLDSDALSYGQRLVGVKFRVQYDSMLLKPLALYEGTFLQQFNNTASPPYTLLIQIFEVDPLYGSNALVGILLLPPVDTGVWTNFPVGSGTLATISFEAIAQPGKPQSSEASALTLTDTQLINTDLDDIPHTSTQSGQYQILPLTFTIEPTDVFAQQHVVMTTKLPAYPITYTWNYGDGTSEVHNAQGSGTGANTTSVDHIYASPGTYHVTLTCTVGDTVSGTYTSDAATDTVTVQANNRATLGVAVDSGSVYFRGETAEFSVLTTNNGEPTNTTAMEALLYHGSSLQANLTAFVQVVTTGMYRITYSIPADASFGTYTLLVKTEYYNARGTNAKTFQISQMLTAAITQIEDGIATIQTDLNTIRVNLTAINASISGLIVDAKGTLLAQITSSMGTLTTRLDLINATVTSINGNTATITTTLGEVKTQLTGEVKTQLVDLQTNATTTTSATYAAVILSMIAMILAAMILMRIRKKQP